MYFVVNMMVDKKYDHDLVTEDYYKKEVEFNKDMVQETNAKSLAEDVSWKKTAEGIIIEFPKTLQVENITGNVFLYRPSNKQFDFEMPISLSNHNLLIPDKRLLGGRWNIKVYWQYNDTSYLFKKDIIY